MTTTFEDNTEVTLSDLNNVAVDLGHTDFSAFSTEKFGVDKLNQITSDLVSSGVLRTGDNGALGCEVIASGGMAYVQPGVIVFASGAKIHITQPVGVDLIASTYIYAIADTEDGTAKLEVSDTEPSGDYVMLAEVDADGVVTDRRTSSVAKVIMTADVRNVYHEIVGTIEDGSTETTVNVGTNAFSYIYVSGVERINSAGTKKNYIACYNNAAMIEDGKTVRFEIGEYTHKPIHYLYILRDGQQIQIKLSGGGGYTVSGDYTINLLIM